MSERRDKAVQVNEVKQGLGRLRLACSLGVAARDLATAIIEVPREGIGRVRLEELWVGERRSGCEDGAFEIHNILHIRRGPVV